jgi:hypothetical protein
MNSPWLKPIESDELRRKYPWRFFASTENFCEQATNDQKRKQGKAAIATM